jgi:5-methylcytosine-specific restriction endonuclease McrA
MGTQRLSACLPGARKTGSYILFMQNEQAVANLSNAALLRGLHDIVAQSRRVEADLVAHISEVDARGLFREEAAPSMFVYCTDRLHLSDAEAYLRLHAGRAARRFPILLEMLRQGRLHLSGLVKLAPHLTADNLEGVLARASFRSKREIEELIAEMVPRPDVPCNIRKLPERKESPVNPSPASPELRPDAVTNPPTPPAPPRPAPRPPVLEPLAPARHRVEFTASSALRDKLERLLNLLRAADSTVDLAAVIDAAVTEKLERLEARRFGLTKAPRTDVDTSKTTAGPRAIPAAIRRAVFVRDGGQCTYRDRLGHRCPERHDLQYHHRHPHAYGGDRGMKNIAMLCGPHNRLVAEIDFGPQVVTRRSPQTQPGDGAP